MYQERITDHGDFKLAARKYVGALLDVNPATLRNWVEKSGATEETDKSSAGVGNDAELKALGRENAELRRAYDILKTASAFFAAAEVVPRKREVPPRRLR